MSPKMLYIERPRVLEHPAAREDAPRRGGGPASTYWRDGVTASLYMSVADAYRRTGGLLGGDDVALLMRGYLAQPISVLARWIVTRRVLSFVWQSQTLVPMFQFDRSDMSLRDGPSQVINELVDTFDDWELAAWFAQPNSWLHDIAPIDEIETDLPAVLRAARADRFVARG